jgi:hypothetical protein
VPASRIGRGSSSRAGTRFTSRCASRSRSGTCAAGAASAQGNHLHLIVEARDKEALSRGLRRIEIRMAKRLNKLMGRRSGQVFPDRYHAHILKTPTEVANALAYVRGNYAVHARRRGEIVALMSVDRFSSAALVDGAWVEETGGPLVAAPRTWLLVEGWRRASGSQSIHR